MKVEDYKQLPSERAQIIVQTLWKNAAIIASDDIELKEIEGEQMLTINIGHVFSSDDIETLQKLKPNYFRFVVALGSPFYILDIFI